MEIANAVHWRYYSTDLAPEFWVLLDSLDEMARRWAGPINKPNIIRTLSGRYCSRLRDLHRMCEKSTDFPAGILEYTGGMGENEIGSQNESMNVMTSQANGNIVTGELATVPSAMQHDDSQSSHTLPRTASPEFGGEDNHIQLPQDLATHMDGPQSICLPVFTPSSHESPDELSAISRLLMDQKFVHLDRVISFEDMVFTTETMEGGPQSNWIDTSSIIDS
jgi:hypothetical protein